MTNHQSVEGDLIHL